MTTVERGLKAAVLQPHTGCSHRVSLSICLCVMENTAKRKWLPVSALTCLWSRNLCQKKYGAYNDITPHNLTMGSPRIVNGCPLSWLAQVNGQPVALVEYLGKCTRAVPHGNSNCSDRHYVRTPSTTMTTIAEQVKTGSAKVIYDSMIMSLDIDNAPRDGRVVANKKYHDNRKQRRQAGNQYRVTFADEMQTLCSMVPTDDFIRSVTVTNARIPQMILYSDRQMTDIKSFCFDRINGSVLSFDKTYNLGNMYVTVGVYRKFATLHYSGPVPATYRSSSGQCLYMEIQTLKRMRISSVTYLCVLLVVIAEVCGSARTRKHLSGKRCSMPSEMQ